MPWDDLACLSLPSPNGLTVTKHLLHTFTALLSGAGLIAHVPALLHRLMADPLMAGRGTGRRPALMLLRTPDSGATSKRRGLTVLTDEVWEGQGNKRTECPYWETGRGRNKSEDKLVRVSRIFWPSTPRTPRLALPPYSLGGPSWKPQPMCHAQKASILGSFYTSLTKVTEWEKNNSKYVTGKKANLMDTVWNYF